MSMIRSSARRVLVAVAAAACGRSAPARVAVVMSSDGTAGARLAAAEIASAARGEAVPLRIGIDVQEGATPAGPSISIADSIARDAGTIAVVGHSNSATSLAASQIYNRERLPQIAPTTTAPLYGSAGPYSFRLVPDDTRQGAFIAGIAAKAGGRVMIVYVNDDYGRALRVAVRDELRRREVAVVDEVPYLEQRDTGAVAVPAAAVLARRPDQLLWLGRSAQLAALLAVVHAQLPRLRVLGGDGVEAARVYASPDRFPGVRFVRFIDPESREPRLQEFRARFHAASGREATAEAVLSYDAVLLVEGALRSGARSREEVREYLRSLGRTRPAFQGLSGSIVFDPSGAVARPHLLAEVTTTGVHGVDP